MLARLPRASMGPAALLTPSKSSALTQLLSRQHFVRVSPLAATLMDFPASVANKRLAAGLNPLNATLTKNRGVGGVMVNQPSPLQRSNAQRFNVPALCGAPCYTVPPMARQRLGQHFLSDLHWREEIARAIRVSPHSTVPLPQDDKHCWIEIGSGHGEMTEHLVAAGAPVHAIELDPSLITGLRRLANNHPNLNVIPGDILEADLAAIASGRRIRVYGNLPYFITSPILQHLFTFADLIDEIHVVIQSEVAARLAAHPGTFSPPPEVTSALVTLRFPGERAKLRFADESHFLDFVKLCFSQKRKTLVNNLRSLAKPAAIREILASLNLRPDSRAEQLSVSQFVGLLRHLSQD